MWKPSRRYSIGLIFIVGGFGGVMFWGGFNTFMEHTKIGRASWRERV